MILTERLRRFIDLSKKHNGGHVLAAVQKAMLVTKKQYCTLDTETTGLDHHDQIIELAIIGPDGETRFNQRFKPSVLINSKAQAVHGISAEDLKDCPTYAEFHEQLLKDYWRDKTLVIFNSEYDLRLLAQTQKAFDIRQCLPKGMCAMNMAADVFGATNKYGTISLANAMLEAGVAFKGRAHSAEADARATRDLVCKIAEMANDVLLDELMGVVLEQNEIIVEVLQRE